MEICQTPVFVSKTIMRSLLCNIHIPQHITADVLSRVHTGGGADNNILLENVDSI